MKDIVENNHRLHEMSCVELDPTTGTVKITLNNQRAQCPNCGVCFVNDEEAASPQD
jgi:hypothetical protein